MDIASCSVKVCSDLSTVCEIMQPENTYIPETANGKKNSCLGNSGTKIQINQ